MSGRTIGSSHDGDEPILNLIRKIIAGGAWDGPGEGPKFYCVWSVQSAWKVLSGASIFWRCVRNSHALTTLPCNNAGTIIQYESRGHQIQIGANAAATTHCPATCFHVRLLIQPPPLTR